MLAVSTPSAAVARAVSVATELFEAFTSLKNASSCVLFVVSTNCKWLSGPINRNKSPATGVVGAAPAGTFIDGYVVVLAANFWLPAVNTFPFARLAFNASAAVARVTSPARFVVSTPSAPVARLISLVNDAPNAVSALPARVTSVLMLAVSTPSAAVARAVSVATELFEAFTSLKNASSCVLFVVSTNCKWLSGPVNRNKSPATGVVGAAPAGTFIDGYVVVLAANFWLPAVNTFPFARLAFNASAAVARVTSPARFVVSTPSAPVARL